MIVGLEGEIVLKEPTRIHLKVYGVIYEVAVSLQTSMVLSAAEVTLHITHIIREDAELLYGFFDLQEKVMFDRLIKINGVGPKVGLAICSTFSPQGFMQIVNGSDVATLKRVPGIGPKSASRILVELSGFMPDMGAIGSESSSNMQHQHEASLALESLGFKKETIAKVLKKCTASNTGEIVKQALKQLQ